ncbi:MAG: GntR family transcriptional regulator [Bacteroidales bacterium]|nr:GntR family transcriptional regulator [Bacteroidales bacterium]
MEFHDYKPIYLQIADRMCAKIIAGELDEDGRIASVRDTATAIGVNPNTVLRAYDSLQQRGIIYKKRGIGYFAALDAIQNILKDRKQEFLDSELEKFFAQIDILGISIDEITSNYYKRK